MARRYFEQSSLLTEAERRQFFRSMVLFRLSLIALIFCIVCWVICAVFGPIDLFDQRPVAFWLLPAGLFAILYYSYALFTEMSGDLSLDRWWRWGGAIAVLMPLSAYFTVAGLLFLFFTVSEVDVLLDSLPFWPLENLS